jgi:ERF superfamily protein
MTETSTAPAANGELFKALAQLQAKLPSIRKGNKATVKSDKGSYSYDYADLTDVSEALLPLMGSLGLAFTARPTMVGGDFGLAYSLVHTSGEREDGFFPMARNGTPQQVGSAITYARRYCLCAVTGVAPGGDDDDAAAAENRARQSAGDMWEDSAPRPRQNGGNGNGQRGQVSRPAQQPKPAAEPAPEDVDPDAQVFADEAHEALTLNELEAIHKRAREAGKVGLFIKNPSSGGLGKLAVYLDWRRKAVKETEDALAAFVQAAAEREVGDIDGWFRTVMGMEIDAATASQLRTALKTLQEKAPVPA